MNKYKKLLSNTAILGAGTLGSKLLVFLLMPLYTHCLTSAQYGTADIITQTANLLFPVVSLGICEGVFRFALDKSGRSGKSDKSGTSGGREEVLSTGFFILCAGIAVFAALYPLINKIEYFSGYTWLIFLYTIFGLFHSLLAQYIRACGNTRLFAVQGIICTLLTVGLNVLFLIGFSMKIEGYILSVILADAAVSLFLLFYARLFREIKPRFVRGSAARAMLRYSIPLIPTTIFWWITNVADRYMITYSLGSGVNGLYAVAFKVPTLLILVSGIFIEAWQLSAVTERTAGERGKPERTRRARRIPTPFGAAGDAPKTAAVPGDMRKNKTPRAGFPRAAQSNERKIDKQTETSKSKIKPRGDTEFFGTVFNSFQAVMFISGAAITAFAKIITKILVAPAYYDSWRYIPTLAAATVFSSLVTFMGSVYLVEKKSILSFTTSMTGAVLNIILNFLLIPLLGATGAAIATFFSYLAVYIIRSVNVGHYMDFDRRPVKIALNTAVLAVQCVTMVYETRGWIITQTLCCAAIFALNVKPIITGISGLLRLPGRRGGAR